MADAAQQPTLRQRIRLPQAAVAAAAEEDADENIENIENAQKVLIKSTQCSQAPPLILFPLLFLGTTVSFLFLARQFLFTTKTGAQVQDALGLGAPFSDRAHLSSLWDFDISVASGFDVQSNFGKSSLPSKEREVFSDAASVITNSEKSVAVVGAGFAGLTAALELKRRGFGKVTVLDRNLQVGGRAVQFNSENGMAQIFVENNNSLHHDIHNDNNSTNSAKQNDNLTFTFDFGPSWYWFPDVFDEVFRRFGKDRSDYYALKKLEPAYRMYRSGFDKGFVDVPNGGSEFVDWVGSFSESNSLAGAISLRLFFGEAHVKYTKGIQEWIWKPMLDVAEFIDPGLWHAAWAYDMFCGFGRHLRRFFGQKGGSSLLQEILGWPVIFVGASPENSPAMYSLMTFGGHMGGTWYPINAEGENKPKYSGLSAPALALRDAAIEEGVEFLLGHEVTNFEFTGATNSSISSVCFKKLYSNGKSDCLENLDGVLAAADYNFVEQKLLPANLRKISEASWADDQVMSPSTLLYYLGFNRTIPGIAHHTFFFSKDLAEYFDLTFMELNNSPLNNNNLQREKFQKITDKNDFKPLFYTCAATKTDDQLVRNGDGEALFVLVPVPYRFDEYEEKVLNKNQAKIQTARSNVLDKVFDSMSSELNLPKSFFEDHLEFKKSYGPSEFKTDFNAHRGNAFGHANILTQSLILKPSLDSKVENLVFAGQLTNPGPGVPPSMVSGIVAGGLLEKKLREADLFFGKTSQRNDINSATKTAHDRGQYLTWLLLHTSLLSVFFNGMFGSGQSVSDLAGGFGFVFGYYDDIIFDNIVTQDPNNISDENNQFTLAQLLQRQINQDLGTKIELIAKLCIASVSRISSLIFLWPILSFLLFIGFEIVCMAFLIICLVFPYLCCSRRGRSYAYSVWLMWKHGTTYFGASLLMNPLEFFDTAAMYALFRVADDIVDTLEPDVAGREKQFDIFVEDFNKCLQKKKGDFDLHPCFPAIIETSVRRKYGQKLFDDFFKSMRMDLRQPNICYNWDDNIEYMRGSAAVIGDFMLPILMPGEENAQKRADALPYAQALGNAFQLTNMIRDINEDLGLNRCYMPADVLRKFGIIEYVLAQGGVDYARSNLATELLEFNKGNNSTNMCEKIEKIPTEPSSPSDEHVAAFRGKDPRDRFVGFMEEMFDSADQFYDQADIGIEMLPDNVRELIRFARTAYQNIQNKIREKDYDIWTQRVSVSRWQKLKIALNVIPPAKLCRLFMLDLCFAKLFNIAPFVSLVLGVLIYGELLLPLFLRNNFVVTYAAYHVLWTFPALFISGRLALGGRVLDPRRSKQENSNVADTRSEGEFQLLGMDRQTSGESHVVVADNNNSGSKINKKNIFETSSTELKKVASMCAHWNDWTDESRGCLRDVFVVNKVWHAMLRAVLKEDETKNLVLNISKGDDDIHRDVNNDNNSSCYRAGFDGNWYQKFFLRWSVILCTIAFVYATPWDNFLVYAGCWGYDDGSSNSAAPSRVLFTIGWVPIEEYSFFLIETILVCFAWKIHFSSVDSLVLPPNYNLSSGSSAIVDTSKTKANKLVQGRRRVSFLLLSLFVFGLKLVLDAYVFDPAERANGLYLGLILVWCAPILMLIWSVGAECLLANRKGLRNIILPCWMFLSLSDCWAIRQGCWAIERKYILPAIFQPFGIDNLPLEECLFFLVTSLMCAWGLHVAMTISSVYKLRKETLWAEVLNQNGPKSSLMSRVEIFEEAVRIVHHWDGADSTFLLAVKERRDPAFIRQLAEGHFLFAIGISILFLVGKMLFSIGVLSDKYALSLEMEMTVVAICSIMSGLPHGALDPLIIAFLGSESSRKKENMFSNFCSAVVKHVSPFAIIQYIPYVSLMIGTLCFWRTNPVACVTSFLGISVFHFGRGDWEFSRDHFLASTNKLKTGVLHYVFAALEVYVRGGFQFVCYHYYTAEIVIIFSQIIHFASGSFTERQVIEDQMVFFMRVLELCYLLHQTAMIVVVFKHLRDWLRSPKPLSWYPGSTVPIGRRIPSPLAILLEIAVLQAIFTFLSPLIAFAIYFNVFHSLRHVVSVWAVVFEKTEKKQFDSAMSNDPSPVSSIDSKTKRSKSTDARVRTLKVFVAVALLFTVFALIISAGILALTGIGTDQSIVGEERSASFAHACFVGITALTTPHFILVECMWWQSRHAKKSQKPSKSFGHASRRGRPKIPGELHRPPKKSIALVARQQLRRSDPQLKQVTMGKDPKPVGNWTKIVMNRYKIDGNRFLGQGSFSIVYAALDMHTGKEVAVKSYKCDTSAASDAFANGSTPDLQAMYDEFHTKKQMYQGGRKDLRPELEKLRNTIKAIETKQEILFKFKRQVKVLERIQDYGSSRQRSDPNRQTHPSASYRVNDLQATTRKNIDELDPACLFVRMLDYSKDPSGDPGFLPQEDACYIVLEMAMFTLQDYLKDRLAKKSYMNIQDIHSIVCSMIHMVCVLHACQLCHLDIKPENIMMTEDKCWKLIDVDGCVAAQETISVDDPTISFTPLYAAPEFCKILVDDTIERLQISRCMDSWSVGMSCVDLVFLRPCLENRYCDMVRRHDSSLPYFQWLSDESQPFVIDSFGHKEPREKYDMLYDMLSKLLHKNQDMRWSIPQCLEHPFYRQFPLPAARRQMESASSLSARNGGLGQIQEATLEKSTSSLYWEDGQAYGMQANQDRLRSSVSAFNVGGMHQGGGGINHSNSAPSAPGAQGFDNDKSKACSIM